MEERWFAKLKIDLD